MNQYNTIEDAIVALTQKYGIEILENTSRFIALLSDFAPNFPEAQLCIRQFSRANGMNMLIMDMKEHKSYAAIIATICSIVIQATAEDIKCHEIVGMVKKIPSVLDSYYSAPIDAKSVYDKGMEYYRKYSKDVYMPIAVLILEEAWHLGCVDALLYISSSYLKGKGIPQNKEKGMYFLELAAKSNNVRASIELAEYLWKGINIDKDINRSVLLLKCVDDPNAMFLLGEIYTENTEYSKALEYYMLAAERNHVYAQFDVAIAYATGQGTKRNMLEAKKWLHSAAALGHSEARKKLEELGEKWG